MTASAAYERTFDQTKLVGRVRPEHGGLSTEAQQEMRFKTSRCLPPRNTGSADLRTVCRCCQVQTFAIVSEFQPDSPLKFDMLQSCAVAEHSRAVRVRVVRSRWYKRKPLLVWRYPA